MKHFEVTFIVDPVLSGDELKSTVDTYADMIKAEGCKIVAKTEMGLRQLAYVINKRSSGIYFVIEFQADNGEIIAKLELALRRDERIMRYLTVSLDKFGVKYNDDKRAGKIGKVKEKVKPEETTAGGSATPRSSHGNQSREDTRPRPAAETAAPVVQKKETATEPVKAELAKVEPAREEPSKVEPAKEEPVVEAPANPVALEEVATAPEVTVTPEEVSDETMVAVETETPESKDPETDKA